jgi:hypothetical protein
MANSPPPGSMLRGDLFDRDGFVGTCTASLLVDEVAAPY